MKILIINGPNLHALGRREVGIYGSKSWDEIALELSAYAATLGVDLLYSQSNYEGALIDRIWQAADEDISGIVINPGGLTHTSVSLLDALRGASIPAVEVHLSNIFNREGYRHESVTAPGCIGIVAGFHELGYRMALYGLVCYLRGQEKEEIKN